MCPRPLSGRSGSVYDDWRCWLREPQNDVFRAVGGELEARYAMLSVTLNEALALCREGALRKAQQEASCCGELAGLLAMGLEGTLQAVESHARHYGTLPNAAPLNPANFRVSRSQRVAWVHTVLCRVLFSDRSQFFHKLRTLEELVEDLAAQFHETTLELAGGAATDAVPLWEILDQQHYDLNTCLRETVVVLKSFLRVLPEEEVDAFRQSLETQARASAVERHERRPAPWDRRLALISRK